MDAVVMMPEVSKDRRAVIDVPESALPGKVELTLTADEARAPLPAARSDRS